MFQFTDLAITCERKDQQFFSFSKRVMERGNRKSTVFVNV